MQFTFVPCNPACSDSTECFVISISYQICSLNHRRIEIIRTVIAAAKYLTHLSTTTKTPSYDWLKNARIAMEWVPNILKSHKLVTSDPYPPLKYEQYSAKRSRSNLLTSVQIFRIKVRIWPQATHRTWSNSGSGDKSIPPHISGRSAAASHSNTQRIDYYMLRPPLGKQNQQHASTNLTVRDCVQIVWHVVGRPRGRLLHRL